MRSCHLIKSVESKMGPPPTFNLEPGKTMHGPYADPKTICPSGGQGDLIGAPTIAPPVISTRSRM